MDLNHDHKEKILTLFIITCKAMFIMKANHLIPIGFNLKYMFLSMQLTDFLGDQEFTLISIPIGETPHTFYCYEICAIGGTSVMHSLKDNYDQYY